MMGRERRSFVRRSGQRDASLFVIAAEGAVTERRYFEGLKERLHNPRIHVEFLTRSDPSRSSPHEVLATLANFANEWITLEGDQLWLVIDRDPQSWKVKSLAAIARECQHKGYFLAVSNPCFELWLLLHSEDVPNQPQQGSDDLLRNAHCLLKTDVARYHKPTTEFIDVYLPHTAHAIERAIRLDIKPKERWPSGLGTRVYRLIKQLVRL
jgi:hypothetical protein